MRFVSLFTLAFLHVSISQECEKTEEGTCAHSSVTVIPNFFSAEECKAYRSVYINPNSTRNHDDMILVGEVEVKDADAQKLIAAFDRVETRPASRSLEAIPGYPNPRKVLHAKHTHLKRSSDVHQDYYTEGIYDKQMVTGNNAFVFLNDNPSAQFHHGKSLPIPAKEGTLLIFPGAEWHWTEVAAGDLHLFGPMDTDYLLTVGFTDAPSDAPSEVPSETPSNQPTEPPTEKCGCKLFDFSCHADCKK